MTDRIRTKADLEATFRHASDPNYADELENNSDGVGWDTVAGAAEIQARASSAVRRNTQGYMLLPSSTQSDDPASGPVKASGLVRLRRTASAALELVVGAGKKLAHSTLDSTGQPATLQDFVLAADVTFAAGELGPIDATAIATRPGDQGNLPAGTFVRMADEGRADVACTVSAGNKLTDTGDPDVFWEGLVGRYVRVTTGTDLGEVRRVLSYGQVQSGSALLGSIVVEGAALTPGVIRVDVLEWSDFGLSIEQPEAFTTGRHGTLDAIGRERQMGRAFGEGDPDYRYRLSDLPDTISPAAIERTVARILTPYGIPYRILETREGIPGFILDHSPLDVGSLCDPLDPWFGSLLLTENASKRFFVVLVGVNRNLGAYGLPLDAMNAGINAYDSASQPGDGGPVIYNRLMQTLYDEIQSKKGFGVAWKLMQDPCL